MTAPSHFLGLNDLFSTQGTFVFLGYFTIDDEWYRTHKLKVFLEIPLGVLLKLRQSLAREMEHQIFPIIASFSVCSKQFSNQLMLPTRDIPHIIKLLDSFDIKFKALPIHVNHSLRCRPAFNYN
jgi:hypothetical protein